MAEVLTEKEKIKRLKISLIIAFAVILIVGLRIVKCNDDRVLIFSVDSDNAWVLIPTTIHTNHGEIHLRLFTKVEHSDGYLSYVINKKGNIKQNLVIRGNKIENFHSVSINRG
jgi:hypothetical protein